MSNFFFLKERLTGLIFGKENKDIQFKSLESEQTNQYINQSTITKPLNKVERKANEIMTLQDRIDSNESKNIDDDENKLAHLY